MCKQKHGYDHSKSSRFYITYAIDCCRSSHVFFLIKFILKFGHNVIDFMEIFNILCLSAWRTVNKFNKQ